MNSFELKKNSLREVACYARVEIYFKAQSN